METVAITDNQIIAEINDNGEGETYSDYEIHQMYDDMLDEVYLPCEIAGHGYETSSTLKQVDPIAYRVGFDDWCSSEELNELEYRPAVDKNDNRIETAYAYRKDIETAKDAMGSKS